MEYKEECDVAIMVHNYLIEQRLMRVAEEFSKASPYLPKNNRCPGGCMYLTAPFRSLQEVVREYVALHRKMKLLLMNYHKEVSLPHEKTTWEKVQYVVECFHSKMSAEQAAPDYAIAERSSTPTENSSFHSNNVPSEDGRYNRQGNLVVQEPIEKPASQPDDPIIYQYADPLQMTLPVHSQLDQGHFVYQLEDLQRVTLSNGDDGGVVEQNPADQQMVLYVVDESGQRLETNGESIVLVNNQDMQGCSPAMTISYEEDVTVGQHVEIRTEFAGSGTPVQHDVPSSELPSLPALMKSELQQAKETIPLQPADQTIAAPNEIVHEEPTRQSEQAKVYAVEQQAAVPMEQLPPVTPVEPKMPLPTVKCTELKPPVPKFKIDLDALEEWNRIRSINKSNFDDYMRETIYLAEARNRLADVLNDKKKCEKKTAASVSKLLSPGPRPTKAKSVLSYANKIKPPRSTVAMKKCSVRMKQPLPLGEQGKKPPAVSITLDSDSSDFASSMDEEDGGVREMTQNIKRYRRQQTQQPTGQSKEKQTKEPTTLSNTFNSPASMQPRTNIVVGRSPRPTTVKRNLSNRTPSTSPISTPKKRTKQRHQQPTVPVTSRVGTARQQQMQAKRQALPVVKKKSGEKTKPAALVEAASNNRRPVRACAARRSNEKLIAADKDKTKPPLSCQPLPRKQTNEENVPPRGADAEEPITVEEVSESITNATTTISIADTTKQQPPILEEETPTPVEVGEAAIYAVLAQLHGAD
uniref:Uncharacterized protein n=1 Tax=Anopheles christyi TaxID=43041 RepID=A0A182JTK4_9DIPT